MSTSFYTGSHIHRLIFVRGRVQGIGFRRSAIQHMRRLSLAGTVMNRTDQRVEMHVEGPVDAVEVFVAWARSGPIGARVDALIFEDRPLVGLSGTHILR